MIIHSYRSELGEKFREFGAIYGKRAVGGQYPERAREYQLLDESGSYILIGFLHHPDECVPFEVIKAHLDAVAALVGDRRSPSFVENFCH